MALTVVIIGASGDLTARKLVPSLYSLAHKDRLPEEVRIVGVARSPLSDDEFRAKMKEAVQEFAKKDWQPAAWEKFAPRLHYVPGDAAKPGGLDDLRSWLGEAEGSGGGRRLYYLAVAPTLYADIVTRLGETGMNKQDGGWRRLVIEKPFGR